MGRYVPGLDLRNKGLKGFTFVFIMHLLPLNVVYYD